MPIKDLLVGIQYNHVKDLREEVNKLKSNGCSYICSGLLSSDAIETYAFNGAHLPYDEFWPDDMLSSREWSSGIVGVLPDLNKELESGNQIKMKRATKLLNRLLEYCHHLSIAAVMFDIAENSFNLAQMVKSRLELVAQHFTFWAKVSIGTSGSGYDENWEDEGPPSWYWFNKFRKMCGVENRLLPVIKLNADLPSDSFEIDRWCGENIAAICLPLSIFQTNEKGYPVLSRRHQIVLKKFFNHGVQIILEVPLHKEAKVDLDKYQKYINHLYKVKMEELINERRGTAKAYSIGWENYLQAPLQPLMDNLESQTYETFERDPHKYQLYYDALCLALRSKASKIEASKELIVVVAGAGRGPLVTGTLKAAETTGTKVRVYALEKNRSAEVRLMSLNKNLWGGKVTVVCTDMRYWNAPEKADIIVSELLGSLGDNELSPECLDGAENFMKDDGIIIPEEYSSYIAPIMSNALFSDVNQYRDIDKYEYAHLETQYVVFMTKKFDIAKPGRLFTFSHPNPEDATNRTNDRYTTLEFDVAHDCDCHGFAGYFDSILFKGKEGQVDMSIHPDTHTRGMFSWFPIYIPLRESVSLRKGDKLVVKFWRKSTSTKVWYEWTVVAPETLPIHNVNGRSSFLGLDLAQPE